MKKTKFSRNEFKDQTTRKKLFEIGKQQKNSNNNDNDTDDDDNNNNNNNNKNINDNNSKISS